MSNILDVLTNYTSELLGGNRARVPNPFLPSLTSKDYGGEPVAPSLPRLPAIPPPGGATLARTRADEDAGGEPVAPSLPRPPQIPPPVGSSPVRTRAETVLPPVPRAL